MRLTPETVRKNGPIFVSLSVLLLGHFVRLRPAWDRTPGSDHQSEFPSRLRIRPRRTSILVRFAFPEPFLIPNAGGNIDYTTYSSDSPRFRKAFMAI